VGGVAVRARRPSLFASASEAMTAALQWRLLLLWTAALLLPTATMALPLSGVLAAMDWSPRADELARRFDGIVFADLISLLIRSGPALAGAMMVATLLTLLLAPALAALAVTAARRPHEPLGWVALLQGAVADYGRMARLLLVMLVPLAIAGGLVTALAAEADDIAEHARLESSAHAAYLLAALLSALVLAVVHAGGEAARAHLAVDPQLRSGWRAWLRGMALLGRRPLTVMALFGVPTLAGTIAALLPLLVRIRLVGSNGALFWLAFFVTQLAVAAIGWGRAARIFALTQLLSEGQSSPSSG
jgi:hypothetical protein